MDEEKAKRMKQLIERSRLVFLDDSRTRKQRLEEQISGWRNGGVSDWELIGDLYQFAHTLKGTALTLGFAGIHEASERLLGAIEPIRRNTSTTEAVEKLLPLLLELYQDLEV